MLSSRPAANLATPSRSLSSNPTIHPDSVALLTSRVPESLHSVLTQYVFSDAQKPEQSRRLRRLLALERDGGLIQFLEQQCYVPQDIYDLYADATPAKEQAPAREQAPANEQAPRAVRSVTIRRRKLTVLDETKPYTSSEPLPPEAQRRIRAALIAHGAIEPDRRSAPPIFRAEYMFAESIPESLDAPALTEWLRTQATP